MEDGRTYSRAELEEVAGLAAGAASGVFMRAVPEMVMPSGEVSEAVGLALAEFDECRRRDPVIGPVADGEEFPGGDQEPEAPLVPRAQLADEGPG